MSLHIATPETEAEGNHDAGRCEIGNLSESSGEFLAVFNPHQTYSCVNWDHPR